MEIDRALTLTNGINQFSAQFYNETAGINLEKNLVMSPLSANIILALLSLGARGVTHEELNTALYLPDEEFTKAAFAEAIQKLNSLQNVTLKIANKIYVKDGVDLNTDFKKLAVDVFSADAQNIDFTKSDKAANTINTWVEEKTNSRIKDLIQARSLNQLTRIVLVNAIYFKGNWIKKFEERFTQQNDFYLNKNKHVKVDMMYQASKFFGADVPEWNAKIVELPYEKHEMSMVIILPNEIEGLEGVEEKMASGANLTDALQKTQNIKVYLSLPKFKIETSIDLKNILPQMGMKKIFNSDADLSGIFKSGESLYISEAIQKAFIEVNEGGSEAAAATAFFGVGSSAFSSELTMEFNANHPFLFFIRSNNDNVFCGRYIG